MANIIQAIADACAQTAGLSKDYIDGYINGVNERLDLMPTHDELKRMGSYTPLPDLVGRYPDESVITAENPGEFSTFKIFTKEGVAPVILMHFEGNYPLDIHPTEDQYKGGVFKFALLGFDTTDTPAKCIYTINNVEYKFTCTEPPYSHIPVEIQFVNAASGYQYTPGAEVIARDGASVHIRFSASPDGTDFTESWAEGQDYIGFATAIEAPTDKGEYEWARFTADLDGKLDIPTGNNHLWATDSTGRAYLMTWAMSASGNSFVRRNPAGGIKTKAAVNDDEAVNLGQMNDALAELAQRVDEVEQGGSDGVNIIDNTDAYMKTVPTNALPVAAITEIGGATYRFKNLYNPSALAGKEFKSVDENGDESTLTVSEDGMTMGVYPASAWSPCEISTAPVLFRDIFPGAIIGKKYTVGYDTFVPNSGYGSSPGSISPCWDGFTLTEDMYNAPLSFSNGWDYDEMGMQYAVLCDFSNIVLIEQLRQPDTDYDTKVTAVEVVGKNLWPITKNTDKYGVTVTRDEDGVYTINGTSTVTWDYAAVSVRLDVIPGKYYVLRDFAEGDFPQDGSKRVGSGAVYITNNGDLSHSLGKAPETGHMTLEIIIKRGHTYNNCKLKPTLICGMTAPKGFIPHKERTFTVPAEVQALPAYGFGYDKDFYNRIVFRDGAVIYEQRVGEDHRPLIPFVETDITNLMNWDGFIDVEEGGSITFTNASKDNLPSTVIYQVK